MTQKFYRFRNVDRVTIKRERWDIYITIFFKDGGKKTFRASADSFWVGEADGIAFAQANSNYWESVI